MSFLKAVLRNVFTALLAVLLLFEEWGWEPLARAMAGLARLPLWAWTQPASGSTRISAMF